MMSISKIFAWIGGLALLALVVFLFLSQPETEPLAETEVVYPVPLPPAIPSIAPPSPPIGEPDPIPDVDPGTPEPSSGAPAEEVPTTPPLETIPMTDKPELSPEPTPEKARERVFQLSPSLREMTREWTPESGPIRFTMPLLEGEVVINVQRFEEFEDESGSIIGAVEGFPGSFASFSYRQDGETGTIGIPSEKIFVNFETQADGNIVVREMDFTIPELPPEISAPEGIPPGFPKAAQELPPGIPPMPTYTPPALPANPGISR